MIIRQLTKNDLKKLSEFSKKTFSDAFAHLNNPDDFKAFIDTAFTVEKLENELNTEGVLFYFIENQGIVVGYLKLNVFKAPDETHAPKFYKPIHFIKNETLEIERIYVDTPYHGKGVAQKLTALSEAIAQKNKCSQIWLGVWSENPKAIRFYEKSGFETFGEHVFTVGSDDQIDILMVKKL